MRKSKSKDSFGPLFEGIIEASPEPLAKKEENTKKPLEAPIVIEEIPPESPKITTEEQQNRIYTVSELSQELRDTLNDRFQTITLRAEIADFKGIHRSGHLYFGLKDDKAQIRAVMWRGAVNKVPFEIKGGLEVIITGKLDYYAGGGSLQIVVERMEPVGIGALQLKFEQLKAKLAGEGLFDQARKRPIAPINWRIALVTGRSTAALQDMLKIFRHRFPLAEIFIFNCSVQGEKAPGEISAAIERANRYSETQDKKLDLLILARGGGSYEDLFCFNEEIVARSIAQSKLPVISGIGHEIDFTIADLVADRRAATPTHAAQESVPDIAVWILRLDEVKERFIYRIEQQMRDMRQKIDLLFNRFVQASPQKKLLSQKEHLNRVKSSLEQSIRHRVEIHKQKIQRLASVLDALSPLKVFDRGYSVIENKDGQIVRSTKDLKSKDIVSLRLKDGQLPAQIL
ncbi:MAG: exodeoxyribonuclease VII large subunit [Proteobacteria bacterium]|nr:exodeoxyribonuclease VII large subunit [Pseudomonadota bacterium]